MLQVDVYEGNFIDRANIVTSTMSGIFTLLVMTGAQLHLFRDVSLLKTLNKMCCECDDHTVLDCVFMVGLLLLLPAIVIGFWLYLATEVLWPRSEFAPLEPQSFETGVLVAYAIAALCGLCGCLGVFWVTVEDWIDIRKNLWDTLQREPPADVRGQPAASTLEAASKAPQSTPQASSSLKEPLLPT